MQESLWARKLMFKTYAFFHYAYLVNNAQKFCAG
jgi:hypothetical protein